MTVTTESVHPVLTLVVLGRPFALIVMAAGVPAGAEATVPSLIIGAETIAFVRGPAPMNLMTIGGTIREMKNVGVGIPMTSGSGGEVQVL